MKHRGRRPRLGKQRTRSIYRKRQTIDVFDFDECQAIQEIWHRSHSGETMQQIAEDFYRRKLKKGNGEKWVCCRGRGPSRTLILDRLWRAKWAYDRLSPLQQRLGWLSSDLSDDALRELHPEIAAEVYDNEAN